MKHKEGLIPFDLKFSDPWDHRGSKVQVDSPNQRNIMAMIQGPYDPDEEEDTDSDYGDIFWCTRLDGKRWEGTLGDDSLGHSNTWLAIHHDYLFKPPTKGEWDNEENNNG